MAKWDEKKLGPKPPKQRKIAQAEGAVFDDVAPVCPEVPDASHYDNDGNLPPDIQNRMAEAGRRADAEIAALPVLTSSRHPSEK